MVAIDGGVASVAGGSILYSPRAGFVGFVTFSYSVSDGLGGTGSAIVLTTVLLGAGFSALLFSNFPISQTFAVCMEITVFGALIGDLKYPAAPSEISQTAKAARAKVKTIAAASPCINSSGEKTKMKGTI